MKKEDIIRMAREVGILETMGYGSPHMKAWQEDVVRELSHFAALVAAAARAEEREACYALRQTLPNPHEHCQVSAHAYDMAIAAYGAAIRARKDT